MRAATNITLGVGDERVEIEAMAEIPEDLAGEVPEHLILENVPRKELTRAQLEELAGFGTEADTEDDDGEQDQSDEEREEAIREALSELTTKAQVAAWFAEVHPSAGPINPDAQNREDLENLVVTALMEA